MKAEYLAKLYNTIKVRKKLNKEMYQTLVIEVNDLKVPFNFELIRNLSTVSETKDHAYNLLAEIMFTNWLNHKPWLAYNSPSH